MGGMWCGRLSVYLSISLSRNLAIWLSTYLTIWLPVYLAIWLYKNLPVHHQFLAALIFVCLCVCQANWLSDHLAFWLSCYLALWLSGYLFLARISQIFQTVNCQTIDSQSLVRGWRNPTSGARDCRLPDCRFQDCRLPVPGEWLVASIISSPRL